MKNPAPPPLQQTAEPEASRGTSACRNQSVAKTGLGGQVPKLGFWHFQPFKSLCRLYPYFDFGGTVGPICAVLGVSLDEFYGIGDHLTASEETLQAEKDGLEHRLENKRQTIGLMDTELCNLWHSVKLYRWIILGLSLLIIGLFAWCVWVDIHCANYGFWRG